MNRITTVLGLFLVTGVTAAFWLRAEPEAARPLPAQTEFDNALPLEARILELERAVSDERLARQLLQEEVLYLTTELEELRDVGFPGANEPRVSNVEAAAPVRTSVQRGSRRTDSAADRVGRLVAAGMPPEQANWVVAREASFQLEMLNARHESERSGDYETYRQARESSSQQFRDELGPELYEQYLEGSGRPVSIAVNSVMDASPAQAAGLRPGDEIRRYAGQRVYNMSDLNRLTVQGTAGETVYVEIVRDGLPMQIALPRGPVGISGGRRGRR